MLIKIASGQVWDTDTAGFVANKTDGQGIEELSDYQGNPANVDFLKDYLLKPVRDGHAFRKSGGRRGVCVAFQG